MEIKSSVQEEEGPLINIPGEEHLVTKTTSSKSQMIRKYTEEKIKNCFLQEEEALEINLKEEKNLVIEIASTTYLIRK